MPHTYYTLSIAKNQFKNWAIRAQQWYGHISHYHITAEGLKVGNVDLSQVDMTVIVLKNITTDTNASVETLLEVLSKHIDTLADASHYFVIDPTDTTIMSTNINGVSKKF